MISAAYDEFVPDSNLYHTHRPTTGKSCSCHIHVLLAVRITGHVKCRDFPKLSHTRSCLNLENVFSIDNKVKFPPLKMCCVLMDFQLKASIVQFVSRSLTLTCSPGINYVTKFCIPTELQKLLKLQIRKCVKFYKYTLSQRGLGKAIVVWRRHNWILKETQIKKGRVHKNIISRCY